MSRLSYTPSPQRPLDGDDSDHGKSTVAKPNPHKKGKKVGSEDGKQDLKSVKQKKKPAKKAVANGKNKEETEDSVVQGVKCVKGAKKGDTNSKPQIERDNNEVARSNISHQVSPEPEFLHFETPLTFQSSPKLQSVEFTEGNDPIQCLCLCPFECGTEPSEISLMKCHIMENIVKIVNMTKKMEMKALQLRKTI